MNSEPNYSEENDTEKTQEVDNDAKDTDEENSFMHLFAKVADSGEQNKQWIEVDLGVGNEIEISSISPYLSPKDTERDTQDSEKDVSEPDVISEDMIENSTLSHT